MGNTLIRIVATTLFIAGCEAPSVEDVAAQDAAVTTAEVAGAFSIEAPPGDYNAFSLDISCSHDEGPDGGYSVWTRSGYTIEANHDCLDCLLPSVVVVGRPVDAHASVACVPSDEHTGCEPTDDVSGLRLRDLLKPATLDDGEQAPVAGIDVVFSRVHEVWNDDLADGYGTLIPYPRVDVATTRLSVASDGVISAGADWTICEDALNSDDCF